MKVAIIGGGITGLSALYELSKHPEVDAELFEASQMLGGKIRSYHREDFVVERGADSFLARKPELMALVSELGIEDQLVTNETGQAFILYNEELHPIPKPSSMGIPSSLKPLLSTSLLSTKGKMRASLDLVKPKEKLDEDVAAGQLFRYRFGDEMVDRLLEPLLSGIYAGSLNELSLESTLPQFKALATKHRSLIKASEAIQKKQPATGTNTGQFRTFKNGLITVIEALEAKLDQASIHKDHKLVSIERDGNQHRLSFENGHVQIVDAVIMTVPQPIAALTFVEDGLSERLERLRGTSVATVALAFRESDVSERADGTGFLVPKGNDTVIKAVTFVDKKWPTSVPDGHVLLRSFVGRPGQEEIVNENDDVIVEHVIEGLSKMLKINGSPLWYDVERWQEAMPTYTVGHKHRVQQWREAVNGTYPYVLLAGASYDGVGLPDCVRQGTNAANQIVNQEKNNDKQ